MKTAYILSMFFWAEYLPSTWINHCNNTFTSCLFCIRPLSARVASDIFWPIHSISGITPESDHGSCFKLRLQENLIRNISIEWWCDLVTSGNWKKKPKMRGWNEYFLWDSDSIQFNPKNQVLVWWSCSYQVVNSRDLNFPDFDLFHWDFAFMWTNCIKYIIPYLMLWMIHDIAEATSEK